MLNVKGLKPHITKVSVSKYTFFGALLLFVNIQTWKIMLALMQKCQPESKKFHFMVSGEDGFKKGIWIKKKAHQLSHSILSRLRCTVCVNLSSKGTELSLLSNSSTVIEMSHNTLKNSGYQQHSFGEIPLSHQNNIYGIFPLSLAFCIPE